MVGVFRPSRPRPDLPLSDQLLAALSQQAVSPAFWLVGGVTIFVIAVSKGMFGGGVASLGVPMLSLITDPISAAIILAPLICLMDMFTLRTFGPSSWSKPDLRVLIPGLIFGLGVGWLAIERVDPRLVALMIGTISLSFALHWFWKQRSKVAGETKPASMPLGLVAGAASGFTTFIAHAGGPPVAMYLMRRNLGKTVFVGTTTAVFTLGNFLKLGPYGILMSERPETLASALLFAPIIPFGVWLGLRIHKRLSYEAIMLATNILLIVGGLRLIWQATGALMQ